MLKEADTKAEKLSSEIFELRRRIGSALAESDRFSAPPVKARQGTLNAVVTPKHDKKQRRSSVLETLQNCDDHLSAISKFDDKIAKLEEFLTKMKADLYGSMETVVEKINKTAAMVDPPKRPKNH